MNVWGISENAKAVLENESESYKIVNYRAGYLEAGHYAG